MIPLPHEIDFQTIEQLGLLVAKSFYLIAYLLVEMFLVALAIGHTLHEHKQRRKIKRYTKVDRFDKGILQHFTTVAQILMLGFALVAPIYFVTAIWSTGDFWFRFVAIVTYTALTAHFFVITVKVLKFVSEKVVRLSQLSEGSIKHMIWLHVAYSILVIVAFFIFFGTTLVFAGVVWR